MSARNNSKAHHEYCVKHESALAGGINNHFGNYVSHSDKNHHVIISGWKCRRCDTQNPPDKFSCNRCGEYK